MDGRVAATGRDLDGLAPLWHHGPASPSRAGLVMSQIAPLVRIAVAGAGLIGRTHIEVLRRRDGDYALAAIADPAPASVEFARSAGAAHYAEIEDMLDDARPDGVILAVPNQQHVPTGLACIARGVPILVEKPIADTLEAAMTLVEAAEAKGVPVLVGHHRRHDPILQRAAQIVREGGIGRVVAATSMYLSHKPKGYHDLEWRRMPGGGPVLINAIHDVDCLRMLIGEVTAVLAADSRAIRGFAVEDTAAAVLRFENGALGTLICSDTASSPWSWEWGSRENPVFPHEPENCYHLAGTRGSLAVPTLVHRWHEPGMESWQTELTQRRHHVAHASAYVRQMANFAAVIRGVEQPVLTGRDGARTLATTLAITQAAATGRAIEVADLLVRASGGTTPRIPRETTQ